MKLVRFLLLRKAYPVAPFAGAWIEISVGSGIGSQVRSLPSRERGLKFIGDRYDESDEAVAPFAGAWIEIKVQKQRKKLTNVAPFAGAWIEIFFTSSSQPIRSVAPFAGAWIEIGRA